MKTSAVAKSTAWAKAHPDRKRATNDRAQAKKRYGLTDRQYEEINERRHGLCDICLRPNTHGRKLCIDHDHATGQVRGLLCHDCNMSIGKMGDSADRLRSAARYLEQHWSADRRSR